VGAMWPCSSLSERYNICLVKKGKRAIKNLIKLESYELEMVKEIMLFTWVQQTTLLWVRTFTYKKQKQKIALDKKT
jgi:hypothetical protein